MGKHRVDIAVFVAGIALALFVLSGAHRRADGSHMNTVANQPCAGCRLEAELEYLQACWRAALPIRRHRWWPGG